MSLTESQLLPDKPNTDRPGHFPRLLGQKPPLKPKEIWAIRIRLQINHKPRDLALFNLVIDSKLSSCDPVALRFSDVAFGERIKDARRNRTAEDHAPGTI